MIRARAGFGPMMVFLFSSPLLNPIIIGLLLATFGAKLTAVYVIAALGVALGAGWLLQATGFARFIRQDEVQEAAGCGSAPDAGTSTSRCGSATASTNSCGAAVVAEETRKPQGRYHGLVSEAWKDFVKVIPYLLVGIAIGSVIYGFMPTDLLVQYAGPNNPFAIPVAAVIGVPLYIRAEAVIPLASALMAKGVGAGAVLSLIIGSAGASLTELVLLRSLFRMKLILAFVAVIFAMAMIAGYATYLLF